LGVCLTDEDYGAMPKLRRGKKFDWLYGVGAEREGSMPLRIRLAVMN
jgi:hypothetical protein